MTHSFSIDVEEWFDGFCQGRDAAYERRLERQLAILLDLLDQYQTKATFFWLGSRAREYPNLVRTVMNLGHEIGCHGLHHRPVYSVGPDTFRKEIAEATKMLQDITGSTINGFRAPYFSITTRSLWALDVLADLRYTYDSSIYPARHWRYGIPNYPDGVQKISTSSGILYEVPLSVRKVAGYPVPLTGGAYFRIYPYAVTRNNIKVHGKSFVFNIHPWELDADHPRIRASLRERLPHYYSLNSTIPKLERLLTDFAFGPIGEMLRQRSIPL